MHFIVWHDGDPSMRIPGERAIVEIDAESYAEEIRGDYVSQAMDALRASFSTLWGADVRIEARAGSSSDALLQPLSARPASVPQRDARPGLARALRLAARAHARGLGPVAAEEPLHGAESHGEPVVVACR